LTKSLSLSHWCCSLVPALTTTMTLLFSISWGFLTRVVLRCEGGASLPPNHKLVEQASVFMSSGDRVVELHPWTPEIHFSHLLRYAWTTLGYSGSRPPPGNKQIIILLDILESITPLTEPTTAHTSLISSVICMIQYLFDVI
jgi:hypothetical protein